MTQAQRIERHILSGKPLNPLQALNRYGCFRLGARIYDLRQKGLKIDAKIDKKKHYATYRLAANS